MKIVCAATSCKYSSENEDSSSIIFISFPNDDTSTVWAHNCGRPDLMIKSNDELHRNYYICSNHIEERFFLSKTDQIIIAQGAIPTVFHLNNQSSPEHHYDHTLKEQFTSDHIIDTLQLNNCIDDVNNSCTTSYVDTTSTEYQSIIYNADDLHHNDNQLDDIIARHDDTHHHVEDSNLNFCNININIDQLTGMTIRFTNLCRICGQTTDNGIDMFAEKNNELKLREKIHLLLPILIENNDPMPQQICTNCYDKLEIAHTLVVTCLQTDIRLRKYLNLASKYNHEDKFRDLISLHELELNDELNIVVSSAEDLPLVTDKSKDITSTEFNDDVNKTSVLHIMPNSQDTIECNDVNLESTKLDNRMKFVFHSDLNNLLLQPLQTITSPSINNNSSSITVAINTDCLDTLPIDKQSDELDCLNNTNNYQSQCNDNETENTQLISTVTESIFQHEKTLQHDYVESAEQTLLKFKCNICDKMFDNKVELTKHSKLHLKENANAQKRRCGHCSLPFNRRKELQKHITENHGDEQMLFQCGSCDKVYEKWASLDVHEATHRQDKPYLCDICGKSFKHSNNLRGHKRIHLDITKKKRYICDICGNAFRSRFHLGEHINQHDGNKPYVCEECGKAFSKRIQLRQHRLSHGLNRYACPICNVTFNRRGNMNTHLKRHSNRDGMYTCSICEYKCKSMSELKMHRKTHSESDILESIKKKSNDKTVWQCKVCNRIFAKHAALLTHERTHDGNQYKVECDQCGKKLTSKSLKYHIKSVHTSERPHMCQYCGEAFVSKQNVRIHERIHTGERPYVCKLCNMQYRCSSNLSQHMKVHSEVRPYACNYCNKSFTRKTNFIAHERRVHTSIKPFTCLICDKKFAQKNDMIKHTKTHQTDKSLICEECDEIFTTKSEIFKHLESIHKFNNPIVEVNSKSSDNTETYSLNVT